MLDEAFGLSLRSVREERGLSRDQLAERMGVLSGKTIWKYESGQVDARISTVRRFAAALSVDAAELLETQEPRGLLGN